VRPVSSQEESLYDGPTRAGDYVVGLRRSLAHDDIRAVSAAKRRFERPERVPNWRVRADRMKIDILTYPDTCDLHEGAPARTGHWQSFMGLKVNVTNVMNKILDLI
jgi:hypothetical protein